MRGSVGHDALYQLIRESRLPEDPWRAWADEALKVWCLEDKMPAFRADYVYHAVRAFAGPAADPTHSRPILIAPRPYPVPLLMPDPVGLA